MATNTYTLQRIDAVERDEWNALIADRNPFLSHEFLSALERHHCVGEQSGWLPHHIVIRDEQKRLIAATPLYLKLHSHGEFVFDGAWAEAYEQAGLNYYPKLVSAIPFSPVTGRRLLTHPSRPCQELEHQLVEATLDLARHLQLSSIHWLFITEQERNELPNRTVLTRLGCQYHWSNQEYENFDHYLSHFTSRKRKSIRQERRRVKDAGITLQTLDGDEINTHHWQQFYQYYSAIYERKWGFPVLSLEFFLEIGRTLTDRIVMVITIACILKRAITKASTTPSATAANVSNRVPKASTKSVAVSYPQPLGQATGSPIRNFMKPSPAI